MPASPISNEGPAPVRDDVGRLFALALASGITPAIGAHLRSGKDVNAIDAVGRTPLILTASRGHLGACKFLVEAGSNPAVIDSSGNNAADWARDCGHLQVAEYLESLGLDARPSRVGNVDSSAANVVQPLLEIGEWERYAETTIPDYEAETVAEAEAVQRTISLHDGDFDDEDWRDVAVSLPSTSLPKTDLSNLSDEVRDFLAKSLVLGKQVGLIDLTEIDRYMPLMEDGASEKLLAHFARIASDSGIQVVGFGSPYRNDLGPETNGEDSKEELSEAAEELLEVDHLLDSRHDPLAYIEDEISRVRKLDRFEEVALFRTIRKASEEEALAIAQSPAALARLRTYCRRVASGEFPLTMMSDLDQPFDQAEIDYQDEDDAAEDPDDARVLEGEQASENVDGLASGQSFAPALPPSFALAMNQLLASNPSPALASTATRSLARAISDLALSNAFFERLVSELEKDGDGTSARVIASCRSAALRARDRVMVAHLPHILRLARRFEGRGMPVSDLVQEGSIGLFRAVDLFDVQRGFRFQTYAMNWVRQSMSRAVADKARLIRIPVHRLETLSKIQRFQGEFVGLKKRDPTPEEVAENFELPLKNVQKLLRAAEEPTTLDDFVNDDESLVDLISAGNTASALDRQIAAELSRSVSRVLASITPREERVLRMRFGIGIRSDHTLEEVGRQFGVTRERIRQIEAKALRKLKHPSRSRKLRSYLDQ